LGTRERKEREREGRRKGIVNAARQLFFTKGYPLTTMDDIADKSELSKGTLYLYFKSKEDIYHAIVLAEMEVLVPLMEKTANENVKGIDKVMALAGVYAEFIKRHRDFITLINYNEVYNIANETTPTQERLRRASGSMLKIMVESIRTGISDGSIRDTVNPMLSSLILSYSGQSVLRLSAREADLKNNFGSTPEQVINAFFDFIYHSLKK
jgi:AcrR family transcriptional regulator